MKRALGPLRLAAVLLAVAPLARADDDRDAPAGVLAPAPVAWRVPPAGLADASRPPLVHTAASLDLLKSCAKGLAAEPAGKGRDDLLAAIADLESGAAAAPADQRQGWIDTHLGALNSAVRTLGADCPESTRRLAAKSAAKLNVRAERWAEGKEFAEEALSDDPDDRDALISRSQANAGLADYARAYADAERAAKLAPDEAAGYTARAAAAYGLGEYMQAVEDARRALALDPEDKTAFALMKLAEGRTRKVPGFETSPQPRLADSVEREYHGMLSQLDEAEEKRLSPPEQPAAPDVARLVADAGSKLSVKDYYGAVDAADKALAADPANARALYFRAAAHNLLGQYGDAVQDATRGLISRPADPALHDARAWACNRMGRYDDAVVDAENALEADPKDAYALADRADADEGKGDFAAMLDDYKAAAVLNPQFEPAYRDAARRHGLAAPALPRDASFAAARAAKREKRRERSFAASVVFSAIGGLLIALGVLHVAGGRAPAPAAPITGPRGLEADYEIGRAIGQGGMGVVYEAVDRKLKRPVAIKMLRDEFKLDDSAKSDFLEEARTVAELSHPAIVDIHNIVEDERGLYLIFERLEGRTLDQVIAEKGRLALPEIKKILGPVCEALAYAHGRDVVHRDMKPSNVMLTSAGGIKVLDFGISRHASRACRSVTQTVVGTPHYMAPEQEYGFVQKENDVFGLGCVLYEMLTGARPYEGSHQAKLAKAYVRASTRVEGVPLALDVLIDRALEPDAEKRIPSPAEFWRELSAVPNGPAAA